jgi:hypothetical protein
MILPRNKGFFVSKDRFCNLDKKDCLDAAGMGFGCRIISLAREFAAFATFASSLLNPSLLQDPLSAFTTIIKYNMPINIRTFKLMEYPNTFMYKIRQHKNKILSFFTKYVCV